MEQAHKNYKNNNTLPIYITKTNLIQNPIPMPILMSIIIIMLTNELSITLSTKIINSNITLFPKTNNVLHQLKDLKIKVISLSNMLILSLLNRLLLLWPVSIITMQIIIAEPEYKRSRLCKIHVIRILINWKALNKLNITIRILLRKIFIDRQKITRGKGKIIIEAKQDKMLIERIISLLLKTAIKTYLYSNSQLNLHPYKNTLNGFTTLLQNFKKQEMLNN